MAGPLIRGAVTAAVLAAAVAGCGGGDGSDGEVRFQVFGDAEELALYRDVVDAYRDRTGREVELVTAPDREAHLQKLATSFSGGSPPAVFLINYRNFATYAVRDVLDPVGPRLHGSGALRRDEFFPQPLEAFTFRDALQCLPQNASSLVVYFNRDLFRRAGLSDPEPDWTYEDFRRTAQRLTEDPDPTDNEPPERYGVGVDPEVVRLAAFVWSAGGDLVDDANDPTRFTLDTPRARQGLQDFLDLQGGDRVAPLEIEAESKPLEDRFFDGQIAMFLSSRREVPGFRKIRDFDWDVAAFPRRDRPATVLHSDAYCIARGDTADDAWRFVEFAAGPSGQAILARGGRIVPSLERVARSPAFLDRARRPRSSRLFLDAIPSMRRLPVAPRWPEIEDAANLALKRAYYLEMTVDEALSTIRSETDPLFSSGRADP